MGKAESDERRNTPRFERVSLVHLVRRGEDGAQQELATGRTLNLSVGGIRLGLDHPLPLGCRLELTLLLGSELLDVGGIVVYQQEGEEGLHAVGVNFTDLDPEARREIERFIGRPPGGDPDGREEIL